MESDERKKTMNQMNSRSKIRKCFRDVKAENSEEKEKEAARTKEEMIV